MLPIGSWGSALSKWRFLFDGSPRQRTVGLRPSCRPRGPRARRAPGAAAPKFCLLYGEGYGHVQTAMIAVSENPFLRRLSPKQNSTVLFEPSVRRRRSPICWDHAREILRR